MIFSHKPIFIIKYGARNLCEKCSENLVHFLVPPYLRFSRLYYKCSIMHEQNYFTCVLLNSTDCKLKNFKVIVIVFKRILRVPIEILYL